MIECGDGVEGSINLTDVRRPEGHGESGSWSAENAPAGGMKRRLAGSVLFRSSGHGDGRRTQIKNGGCIFVM